MTKKASTPATKKDLQDFLEHMTNLVGDVEARMAKRIDAGRRDNEKWKEEIKLHFDVVAENLTHDFRGALTDKIRQHEDRIVRLEDRTGIRN